MTDSLAALLRLRRMEASVARRDLAASMAEEQASKRAARAARESLLHETRLAVAADPVLAKLCGAWRGAAQTALRETDLAAGRAQAAFDRAAQNLAGCRAAARAAEFILDARNAELRRREAIRQQHAMDDATAAKRMAGGAASQ